MRQRGRYRFGRRYEKYRRSNAPSSKSDVVESLLALGDVARNNQLGEAKAALAKARVFIDKFNLTQFEARYQQLMAKAAAFERGEKVERDDASQSRSSGRTGYGYSREDPFHAWQQRWEDLRRKARERARQHGQSASDRARRRYSSYTEEERQKTREEAQRQRRAWERERREARYKATRERHEAKRAQREEAKKAYTRPKKAAHIEWLWTKSYSPKRGKAGERWKAYVGTKTIEEMLAKGGRWSDVKWNITHGLMRVENTH